MSTLADILNKNVAEFGDKVALEQVLEVSSENKIASVTQTSFSHLKKVIASIKSWLITEAKLKTGDAVSIVLPNGIPYICCFFATTCSSFIAAPLNSKYKQDEYKFYLKDAESKLVIVPAIDGNKDCEAAARELGIPVASCSLSCKEGLDNVSIELVMKHHANAEKEEVEKKDGKRLKTDGVEEFKCKPDQVGLFLHTSGTTSTPKGVPLTHSNLMASVSNITYTYDMCDSDKSLLVMPLFHVHGLMCGLLACLNGSGTVVIPIKGVFSASQFWPTVTSRNVNWYTAVPTIQQILLSRADQDYPKENPPKLRFIRSCSSSLAPVILERLEKAFHSPVVEAYAMTEASHMMTSNMLPNKGKRKAGTVGMKTGNLELTIRDDGNKDVGVNKIGQVCIKGPNVTNGYKNRPEANKEAFEGGWFHTGDQGMLDEDGYLILTGRIKELINRGGEKISPLEVDAVLLQHVGVSEAVCFACPDEKYGEIVHAAVIPKESHKDIQEKELREFCNSKLADFKIPAKMYICDDFPRTATGKIQRRHVATHFLK